MTACETRISQAFFESDSLAGLLRRIPAEPEYH